MHEPQTLQKACRLARLVEATLSAYARGSRPVDLSSPSVRKEGPTARSSNYSYQQISRGVMANTPNGGNPRSRRTISHAEMQAKGAKGLCYFCDEKYSLGHKCNLPKHMFVMELEDCMAEELTPVIYSSIIEPAEDTNMTTVECETPMISYCALAGIKGAQTIQVMGYSGKKLVPT
ncbi:hypothetical protein AABB24_007657 [Solanum stoloniferum]|uniref:Retrotransposon gag protein n=1 Tax=Solanum stoloniferum TaxID=62892 RepID=A0ABD2URW8_9SOLN